MSRVEREEHLSIVFRVGALFVSSGLETELFTGLVVEHVRVADVLGLGSLPCSLLKCATAWGRCQGAIEVTIARL